VKKAAITSIVVIIAVIVLLVFPYPVEEKIEEQIPEESTQKEQTKNDVLPESSIDEATPSCSGDARCISGTVTRVLDGDTVEVDGQSIRFALSSAPEMDTDKGVLAKAFVENLCPTGSQALVDEDDKQTQGSYGRIVGIVYCNGINLNEAILESDHGWISTDFCSKSEFANNDWAKKYGC
jgi:micrococcal nuclease